MCEQINNEWIISWSLILSVLYTKYIKMYSMRRDSIVRRTSNGWKIVLRWHAYQQWPASDQSNYLQMT